MKRLPKEYEDYSISSGTMKTEEVLPTLSVFINAASGICKIKVADTKIHQRVDDLDLDDEIKIKTAPLNHPGGAVGYRVEYGGKSICYVTDTEHIPGKPDENIMSLIEGADVFIYDATYCDDNFARYTGFGHSTWQEGARLSAAAGVKHYVIFHHPPSSTDATLLKLEDRAQMLFAGSSVAREGTNITP